MAARRPVHTVPIMPAEPPRWVCWLIALGHALAPFTPVIVLGYLRAPEGSRPATRNPQGPRRLHLATGPSARMSPASHP